MTDVRAANSAKPIRETHLLDPGGLDARVVHAMIPGGSAPTLFFARMAPISAFCF